MMKLLLASLIAGSASVAAAPTPPTPPPAPSGPPPARCKTTGDVLFERQTHPLGGLVSSESDIALTLPTLIVYETGAWAYTETKAGKLTRDASGCLEPEQLRSIRGAIAEAPWKTGTAEFACEAIAATFVEYSSHGKHLYSQQLCGRETLDEKSTRELATIEKILAPLTRPDPITSSRGKPVNK